MFFPAEPLRKASFAFFSIINFNKMATAMKLSDNLSEANSKQHGNSRIISIIILGLTMNKSKSLPAQDMN